MSLFKKSNPDCYILSKKFGMDNGFQPWLPYSGLAILWIVLFLSFTSCSYGPEKQRVEMEAFRAGDTYTGFVVLNSMEFREPAGFINTFPNGGKPSILSQQVKVYEINAQNADYRLLAKFSPDERIWESFSGSIIGFDDQNTPYLQLRGCMRGGECHGDLVNYRYFHLNTEGDPDSLSQLPSHNGLPPIRGSRQQGEVNYVRFSVRRDTLKARFQENADYQPLFTVDSEGNLVAIH